MTKELMKWQKDFLEDINNIEDNESLFDFIYEYYGEHSRLTRRGLWQQKQIVSLFKERMGWIREESK